MTAPTVDLAQAPPTTGALKRLVRAADYLERALEATALAEASVLDRVRERHEAAAARWRELAALSERVAPAPAQRTPWRQAPSAADEQELPCIA